MTKHRAVVVVSRGWSLLRRVTSWPTAVFQSSPNIKLDKLLFSKTGKKPMTRWPKKKSKDGINDRFNFTQEKAHDTEFTFTNVEQKSFKINWMRDGNVKRLCHSVRIPNKYHNLPRF